jgi:hypothetical protein
VGKIPGVEDMFCKICVVVRAKMQHWTEGKMLTVDRTVVTDPMQLNSKDCALVIQNVRSVSGS